MKRSRVPILIAAAVALVVAAGTGLFLLTHELVTTIEPVGPSGRAVRDPFWAATLLLEELGVPTQARYGLGQLPPPDSDAVVIVLAEDPDQRRALADRLVDWVDAGGHVVLAPANGSSDFWDVFDDSDPSASLEFRSDPLLEAFGLSKIQDDKPSWEALTVVNVERTKPTEHGTVETLVTRARVGVSSAYCDTVVGTAPSAPPDALVPGARTQLRAQCSFGAGRLSAVSSTDLFENASLNDDRGDNAAFLWDTVTAGNRPSEVILVLRGDAPSFFELLWDRCWPLLTSLACVLAAWAAWRGQRFGPSRDRPVVARRSMVEHLDAAGSLLWRFHRYDGLVAAMRGAVRDRLARQRPAIAGLHGDDLARAVAEMTHQSPATIRMVLIDTPPKERAAFIAMVQTLQRMWKHASSAHLERTP